MKECGCSKKVIIIVTLATLPFWFLIGWPISEINNFVKDAKHGKIIIELYDCNTNVVVTERIIMDYNPRGHSYKTEEVNYYLTGTDCYGVKWKFKIDEDTYNKRLGRNFNGTVRLEVWENLHRIEKIISVEPAENKKQELIDWYTIYNQQETIDWYNMIYNQNVIESRE